MNSGSRPADASVTPTTDELLAMAYADGELSTEATRVFESRLTHEARLRVLVADQQRIAVLAREAAPAEPLELASLIVERGSLHPFLAFAGRALLVAALVWLAAWLACTCTAGAWCPSIAGAALCALAGILLLVVRAALVRRATHHLDPYHGVRR